MKLFSNLVKWIKKSSNIFYSQKKAEQALKEEVKIYIEELEAEQVKESELLAKPEIVKELEIAVVEDLPEVILADLDIDPITEEQTEIVDEPSVFVETVATKPEIINQKPVFTQPEIQEKSKKKSKGTQKHPKAPHAYKLIAVLTDK